MVAVKIDHINIFKNGITFKPTNLCRFLVAPLQSISWAD